MSILVPYLTPPVVQANEQIKIYDRSRRQVYDSEGSIRGATDINIEDAAFKGCYIATFKVRRADVLAFWVVTESYEVKVFDGGTIIWQGRIEEINPHLGTDPYVNIKAVGWYVVYEENLVFKQWWDDAGVVHLEIPPGLDDDPVQTTHVIVKRENVLEIFSGTGDVQRNASENYRELYGGHTRANIYKISFHYRARTGENARLKIWNVDAGFDEFSADLGGGSEVVDSEELAFTEDTRSFEIRLNYVNSDLRDQNDSLVVNDLVVLTGYEAGHRVDPPNYKTGELAEDVTLLVNQLCEDRISTDFSDLDEPGTVLTPFALDAPTYASSIIQDLAGYGDPQANSWYFGVRTEEGSRDGKPKAYFRPRDNAAYKYVVNLAAPNVVDFDYGRDGSNLRNSVYVEYTDKKGLRKWLRPGNLPGEFESLEDDDSIALDFRRGYFLKMPGQSDETRALFAAQRYLKLHKDRFLKGTMSIRNAIRTVSGAWCSPNRIQGGDGIRIFPLDIVWFVSHVAYNAENQVARISPDLPPDNLSILFNQANRKMGRLAYTPPVEPRQGVKR